MTKEYMNKMAGCTPVDDRGGYGGGGSGSSSSHRGNPEAWERIMASMMSGNSNRGNMAAQGMDGGRQTFSELTTPSSAMKRTIDDVYNDGMMNSDSFPSKSPLPKKSFLQRERIMDEVMRSHMKEALEDLQKSHHSFGSRHSTPVEIRNILNNPEMTDGIESLRLPLSTSSRVGDDNTAIDLIIDTAQKLSKSKSKSKLDESAKNASSSTSSKKSKNDTKKALKTVDSSNLLTVSKPVPAKPRRPFSAYNLFFQLEREFIMNELNEGRKPQEEKLIKQAISKLEEGLIGAVDDDENEEATNQQKDDDDDNPSTGDPASTDAPDKDADAVTGDKPASTDPQDKDGEPNPNVEEPASKTSTSPQNKPDDNASKEPSETKYFVDPDIPERYKHLRLDKHWYSVSHKQKRKHRKTEGSCSFMELTTMVSARWKVIDETDPLVKQYCQKLAAMELKKYKAEIAAYKSELKAAEKDDDDLLRKQVKESHDDGTSKLKKRGRKKKADEKDKSSSPNEDPRPTGRHSVDDILADLNPSMLGDMDMNRFMELARMSGSFQGALAHLAPSALCGRYFSKHRRPSAHGCRGSYEQSCPPCRGIGRGPND